MSAEWLHKMDDLGVTPLHRAFNSGHNALAELLIRQEKEDQSEALAGSTPMHRAAYLGLTEAVQSLLAFGGDAEARDRQGEIPLHKAVREGHYETVKVLVEVSDVNAVSSVGLTPLHWASLAGREKIVALLLEHGADPWIRDECMDGLTALKMAAVMGYDTLKQYLGGRESFV